VWYWLFLLDKCLAARRWAAPPVYDKAAEKGGGGDVVEEQAAQDDTVEEEQAEVDRDDPGDAAYFVEEKKGEKEEKTTQEILESKTTVAEWKMSLERVGPRLKSRSQPASKEWRTHLEQGQKHVKLLGDVFPDSKTNLSKIQGSLRGSLERISGKERQLNKEFESLGADYRERQKRFDGVQETYNSVSRAVSDLQRELADKTDEFESLRKAIKTKNDAITDTTPIRKIKDCLDNLKSEVMTMELRIGIVSQTLLQAKLKTAQGGKSGATAGDDDE